MTPERLAEILGWNQTVFESEARRDPDSLAARIICAVQEAIDTEREACAMVCEEHEYWMMADDIRQRSEQ